MLSIDVFTADDLLIASCADQSQNLLVRKLKFRYKSLWLTEANLCEINGTHKTEYINTIQIVL